NWFKNYFGLRIRKQIMGSSLDWIDANYFKSIIHSRQAYEDDYVLLFCSLCRALGLKTRLVSSIELLPTGKSSTNQSSCFMYHPRDWVEIFSPSETRWIV